MPTGRSCDPSNGSGRGSERRSPRSSWRECVLGVAGVVAGELRPPPGFVVGRTERQPWVSRATSARYASVSVSVNPLMRASIEARSSLPRGSLFMKCAATKPPTTPSRNHSTFFMSSPSVAEHHEQSSHPMRIALGDTRRAPRTGVRGAPHRRSARGVVLDDELHVALDGHLGALGARDELGLELVEGD